MSRTFAAATGAVLLLLLSGCTGPDQASVTAASAEPSVSASAASEAPLTAETPSEAANEAPASPEGAYLSEIREKLPADSTIPNATDGQLLDAARRACEQMASGTDFAEVSVIDGEQPNGLGIREDSALIAAVAQETICA